MIREILQTIPTEQVKVPYAEQYALYGMISAISVALIYGTFSILSSWIAKNSGSDHLARKVLHEHEVWFQWMVFNSLDPRKIKTGFESIEEVRRVAT